MLISDDDPAVAGLQSELRVLSPPLYDYLVSIELDSASLAWSRFRGHVPSSDRVLQTFWNQNAAAFVAWSIPESEPFGVLSLYELNTHDQVANLVITYDPRDRSIPTLQESVALFVAYCFRVWPLRMIYSEVPAPLAGRFSAIAPQFELVGELDDYFWYDGERFSKQFYSLSRPASDTSPTGG